MPVRCGQRESTLNSTRPASQQYPPTQQSGAAFIGSLRSFYFPHNLSGPARSPHRQFLLSHPPEDAHSTRDIHSTQTLLPHALPLTSSPIRSHTAPSGYPRYTLHTPRYPHAKLSRREIEGERKCLSAGGREMGRTGLKNTPANLKNA